MIKNALNGFIRRSRNFNTKPHIRLALIASSVSFLMMACNADVTPADYTKLPEFGSAAVSLYIDKCGECHAAPRPELHDKKLWPFVVNRMQERMTSKKIVPLNAQQEKIIEDYLIKYAKK